MIYRWLPRRHDEAQGQRGQSLVEFALVVPILVIVFMAVVEAALALNAVIGINRASQQAAHTAAIMGSSPGVDCLILRDVETDVMVPNDRAGIQQVRIQRTAMVGNTTFSEQVYDRSGSLDCSLPDGTSITLPYTTTTAGYPESGRCAVLAGCPTLGGDRTTVDNVGVDIRYRHQWATPLNAMLDVFGGNKTGWTISQRNIFRMEPVL
jgi:hypothetical protein